MIYLGESDINRDIFRSHDRRQSFPVLPSQITTNDGYIGGSIDKYFMSTPVAGDFFIGIMSSSCVPVRFYRSRKGVTRTEQIFFTSL